MKINRCIAFAAFNLESVSFLPSEVSVEDFEKVAIRGEHLVTQYRGTNTVAGGVIEVLESNGINILPIVHTLLGALGPSSDAAIEFYCKEIISELEINKSNLDGVILFLHGACWSPAYPDPERYIINAVRNTVGNDVPITVALDYHANIDADSIASANATFAYRKSPHTDTGDTGRRAANCLINIINKKINPVCSVRKPNVLIPSIFSATNLQPLKSLIEEANKIEKSQHCYCDITLLGGFSFSDAHNTGMSVVCNLDGPLEEAHKITDYLCNRIKEFKHELYRPITVYSVDEALSQIKTSHPVNSYAPLVLLEHADRMNDSTYCLEALLAAKIKNVAVPFFWDRQAAMACQASGIGSTVSLDLGGHSSEKAGKTLKVNAFVRWCGVKSYKVSGEYMNGTPINLGLCALVEVCGIVISIVSEFAMAVDDDPFKIFNLSLYDFDVILLRSKTHFRAFYEPIAREILIVDTPDYGTADLLDLPYSRLDKNGKYPFSEID